MARNNTITWNNLSIDNLQLQTIFARFGLPDTVVTDNETCFFSSDFEQVLSDSGIHHWKVTPDHHAGNGLVERAVQILKQGLEN